MLRRAVAAYRPSTQRSELERRFRRLLETPDDRLAVQVDGFDFHRTRRDRERDAANDADLELAGSRVLRLTWDDVTVHDDRTLRRICMARS